MPPTNFFQNLQESPPASGARPYATTVIFIFLMTGNVQVAFLLCHVIPIAEAMVLSNQI